MYSTNKEVSRLKHKLLSVIVIVCLASVLLLIITLTLNTREAYKDNLDKYEQTDINEVNYLTKAEIIELFYDNYEIFCSVAEYVIFTEGVFYCSNSTGDLVLKNSIDDLAFGSLAVRDQVGEIIYNMHFTSILEDETETRVYFNIPNETGGHGLIYSSEVLSDTAFYYPLSKDKWYYFCIIHKPPGG